MWPASLLWHLRISFVAYTSIVAYPSNVAYATTSRVALGFGKCGLKAAYKPRMWPNRAQMWPTYQGPNPNPNPNLVTKALAGHPKVIKMKDRVNYANNALIIGIQESSKEQQEDTMAKVRELLDTKLTEQQVSTQTSYAVLAKESLASSNTPCTPTVFLILQSCIIITFGC